MKDMTTICVKPVDNFGKIITEFTGGKYSHVAIVYKDHVYESAITFQKNFGIKDGVFNNDDLLQNPNLDFYELPDHYFPLEKDQEDRIMTFFLKNMGRKYNVHRIISYAIIILFNKWLGIKIEKMPFRNVVFGYICVDFNADVYRQLPLELFPHKDYLIPDDYANCILIKK